MTAAVSCAATFDRTPPPTHVLTITQPFAGTGAGTVTATGISCPGDCSEAMVENTVVALTATPAADSTFVSWGGAADCADGRVTMTAAVSCAATFDRTPPPTHVLTITQPFAGTGAGTVTATGISCPGDCSEAMVENTVVALTATPAADSTFVSWGGAADCADGRVTISADRACTASFSVVDEPGEPAGYLLTVSQKGTGTGIVTSNPPGIDCGDDCTESYASATAVTLSALPAADSAFAGWGGDSACADGTVAMTADRACKASFSMVDDPESVNRWPVASVPYYINPANADVPRGRARRAIQKGASAWSLQSSADIEFSYAGKTSAASVGLDSTNNVFFRPDSNGSAIASAYYWVDSTGTILDFDIVFWDGGVTLFTGTSGCSDGAYIEDITAHEAGHALGLRHSIVEGATMFESYSLCSTEPRSLAGDDISAVEALYIPAGADAPPADPSALVAASNSREPTSAIDLSWNDDADNEDGYSVERSTTNSDYLEIQQVGANTTAYTDAGLASGTTYWYRVRAFGAGGNSGYANSASAQTDFPGVDPPADDPTDPTLEDALQDLEGTLQGHR